MMDQDGREWIDVAACRSHPSVPLGAWTDEGGGLEVQLARRAAVRVCVEECPVRLECAHYAAETDAVAGVWGGHWWGLTGDQDRGAA